MRNLTRIRVVAITALSFAYLVAEAQSTGPASAKTQVAPEPLAVRGETIYTMSGEPIKDGVVMIRDGKIARAGRAADVQIPQGIKTLSAKLVTPGLIDAHTCLGLQGFLNEPRDQ